VKDYVALAVAINKNYPTMYIATANAVGIVIEFRKPCSISHAAAFLQNCAILKGKNVTVTPILEDGLLCIQ
jgi:hypothetical protein